MTFQLIGVNHRTAPLEVRERLAIPEKRLPEALERLAKFPGVDEAMIVSTCNRVELYVARPVHSRPKPEEMVQFICEFHGIVESELRPHLLLHLFVRS